MSAVAGNKGEEERGGDKTLSVRSLFGQISYRKGMPVIWDAPGKEFDSFMRIMTPTQTKGRVYIVLSITYYYTLVNCD